MKKDTDSTIQEATVEPPLKRYWGWFTMLLALFVIGYVAFILPSTEREQSEDITTNQTLSLTQEAIDLTPVERDDPRVVPLPERYRTDIDFDPIKVIITLALNDITGDKGPADASSGTEYWRCPTPILIRKVTITEPYQPVETAIVVGDLTVWQADQPYVVLNLEIRPIK